MAARARSLFGVKDLAVPESHSIIVARVAFINAMNRNKTKWIYFGVFVFFLVCVIGLQCFHNKKMLAAEHEEWRRKSDSIIAVEMDRYRAAIARRDAKADSIIEKLNFERKLAKLPPLNMRIEGERILEAWEDSSDPFIKISMLGACHYDTLKNQFSDAVVFHLYRPEDVVYLEMKPTTADKFVGKHPERPTSYEIRVRNPPVLSSELDEALRLR